MRRYGVKLVAACILAMCVAATRCGGQPPPKTPVPSEKSAPGGLEGTSWNAVELYGTAVEAKLLGTASAPHLVFGTDGRVSGADGCNRLTGPFTVKANKGLAFGELAVTQMACPDTSAVEQRFHAALKGTSHWSIVKDRLELYGATGKPLAVLEKRTDKGAVKFTPA
jgi:copper homeostasis protein (lipoprotein)